MGWGFIAALGASANVGQVGTPGVYRPNLPPGGLPSSQSPGTFLPGAQLPTGDAATLPTGLTPSQWADCQRAAGAMGRANFFISAQTPTPSLPPPTMEQTLQALGGLPAMQQALAQHIQTATPAEVQALVANAGGEAGIRQQLQQMAAQAPIDTRMLELLQREERHQVSGVKKPSPELPALQSPQFRSLLRLYGELPPNERQILRETLESRRRMHHWGRVGSFSEAVGIGMLVPSGELGAFAVPVYGALIGGAALELGMAYRERKQTAASFERLSQAYTARTGQPLPNDFHWLLQEK